MPPRKFGPEFSPEKTWEELSKNIREIQNNNASNLSFEENHRFAYNMVLNKHGEALYKGVTDLVGENLNKLADDQIIPKFPNGTKDAIIQSSEDELLLKALKNVWDDHTSSMVRLGQILKYMDRVHTKSANVPTTEEMGLTLFYKHIIKPPIKDHIVTAILNQVGHERNGYGINRSAVNGCVEVLMCLKSEDLTVYKRDLEPRILQESEIFYERKGQHLVNSCDAPEFLRRVDAYIEAEESRTNYYLSSQTEFPLRQILKEKLLTPHLSAVVSMQNSGLDVMIDSNKFSDLARLYRLFLMVPTGLPCLKSSLKASVARRGKEINDASTGEDQDMEAENPEGETSKSNKGKGKAVAGIQTAINWVQAVLSLKDKFDAVWKEAFQSSRDVESSLIEAFATFINLNEKSSEFISLFIDDHLKRGLKGKSDAEVDIILDKTIIVFRFISEKDIFERYYKGHLSKRLLAGRSVSDDAERGMLAKLKVECGVQFTQKMEGMFNDMKVSADATQDYHDHLAKTTAPEIELNVTVLTSNCWPMNHSPSPCTLPAPMSKACQSFEQFYLSRHSGRRLTWQLHLGNADVRVRFKSRSHDVNVSTFALVILLLFEGLGEEEFLMYQEIKESSTIDDTELKRQLQSLACAKFKILKKHPPGRDVNSDDSFSFNNDFSCAVQKIKISTVSSRVENKDERKETRDRIDEERRHQMEACIVRIMKDRKNMKHNDLIHEVTQQLTSKFSPEPLAIKKRIEHLIEREYLERCEDRRSYNYLVGDSRFIVQDFY
ncbi:Cullin-domain-containing protein [Phlegmacium glaucopus]|nr:Cullin-domain-containing protein [Phlegmacium glaucopus]